MLSDRSYSDDVEKLDLLLLEDKLNHHSESLLKHGYQPRPRRRRMYYTIGLIATTSVVFFWLSSRLSVKFLPERAPEIEKFTPPVRKERWTVEELSALSWKWPSEPHPSLQANLDLLSESDTKLREYLFATRSASLANPVGLGKTYGKINSFALLAETAAEPARPFESFSVGDRSKFNAIIKERDGTDEMCKASKWQESYRELHQGMMNRTRDASLLEYHCSTYSCGGLADRMLGVVSTFLYAVISNRAISIRWDNPLPFDLIFDSPNVDWSQPMLQEDEQVHPIYGNKTLVQNRRGMNITNYDAPKLDNFFSSFDWNSATIMWIKFIFNRGVVFRSFGLSEILPRLQELGLEYNTAFSCLFRYLLRPKPIVLRHISAYTSFFSLPSIYSIGIQIRTGDASMEYPEYDKRNTVELHQDFFTCAESVAKHYALPSQRVVFYLISDSNNLKADARRFYGDRLIVSGLASVHAQDGTKNLGAISSLYNTIAEMWTLSGTDFHVLTRSSGFGKLATWLRATPDRTIAVYARYNEVTNPGGVLLPTFDCASPTALMSFPQMADDWSYG